MSNEREGGRTLERSQFVVRKERLYRRLFAACGFLTVVVTAGIVLALSGRAVTFFFEVSPVAFLTGTKWSPIITQSFGILPLLSGTLLVTVLSAAIALPVGLAAAIYLSEYASERTRSVLKPALEILAGVPTVIYGYMALVYITPAIDAFLPVSTTIIPEPIVVDLVALSLTIPQFTFVVPSLRTFNALSASIVVGIMIIPMVSSISEDAISAVPDSLREAGYGLGSTKFDVSTKVVVPAATSGIISSYVLAISRAIGETMAVVMAMGQSPQMPYFPNVLRNLAESGQTITSAIVQIANADQTPGATYEALFALGLTLFVITFAMNVVAEIVRQRLREDYQ